MNWMSRIFRRRLYEDLSEEIRLHIEERAEQFIREGMNPQEARQKARRAFGNLTSVEERSREVWQWTTLESMWADARFSVRQLRKSPGFTIAAVLTLALAIGANAIVFGLMDGLILRPLNVAGSETLYGTNYGDTPVWQSYPNYLDLRDRNRSFEDLAAFNMVLGVGMDLGNDPANTNGFAITGNYFDVLGVHPWLGRFFHASDEHGANSAPFVVLTYAYWQTRFGGDRSVIGRTIRLNQHPFTILGVAPPGFQGTLLFVGPDFFVPIVNQEQLGGESLDTRATDHGIFAVLGHLKPGVRPARAVADADSVSAYLEKAYPGKFAHKTTVLARGGLNSFGPAVRAFIAGLMLLAGLILLAACANLGSLFAARASDRSREMALRLALGSNRSRILRQLLTEAGLLSIAGGALGCLGSFVLLRKLSTWEPMSGVPVHMPVTPDAKLYWFALALALISGLMFGIVPVRQILMANPYELVKAGSGSRMGRRITSRDVLLALQIAICAVLVTSSIVAVRGLERSLHTRFGFEPRGTMTASVNLSTVGYSVDRIPAMQRRMIDAVESIPGVRAVGLVNNYPPLVYTAGDRANAFKEETTDLKPSNAVLEPLSYGVSPGYFAAAGTNLLAGRNLTEQDNYDAAAVAVVNREFANKLFGSIPGAIGRHYKLQDGTRVEVIGVVEDGKYVTLTEDQQPATFLACGRSPSHQAYLVVRSSRDQKELSAAIRKKLRELEAGLPVETHTWSNLMEVVLFPARIATMALGVMGGMGALLSITGIFGMTAYTVSRRLRELGIRVALGAQRMEVLKAALGRAFQLLAIGSGAGLVLGFFASRVLSFIVYQATPRDPLVLAAVILTMALLGLLATWIPARRALSVNPASLLHEN
jgi:predicted permease